MLATKGVRFPVDVILVCIRWYAAYPLSYRHLEEMMEERGVFVDHSVPIRLTHPCQKRMLIFRPEVTYPWFPTVADGRYAGILL